MNEEKQNTAGASPASHPTTSDISMFMTKLGYKWSNQAQVYFYNIPCKCLPRHDMIQTIDDTTAKHIYKSLIGDNPYKPIKEIEKVCEKNCPDYNGMEILHKEQCNCSCH